MRARVLVFGASGYSGIELCRLLARHPAADVIGASSDKWAGRDLRTEIPGLSRPWVLERHEALADRPADVAFLATPAETSLTLAPALLARGVRVVDLSGAFRLRDRAAYPAFYGFEHAAPALLAEAHYGLPELCGPPPAGARLVANPGCYATAAALAWAPAVRAHLVEGPLFLDGKSGTSGAGRRGEESYSFSEVADTVRPYRVTGHQHVPEMEQTIGAPVSFVPHLVPLVRGLLVTGQARLADGVEPAEAKATLARAYEGSVFCRVVEGAPEIRRVARSNFVELAWAVDARTRTVVAMAALDNLVKGAAGQAIQNLNLMLGLDERTALSG